MSSKNSDWKKNVFYNIIGILCYIPYKQLILYQAGFCSRTIESKELFWPEKNGEGVFLL